MKYTLIAEDEYGGSKTTREFTEDYLPNVLTEVELFLKGAGFVFDGNLDFVDEFGETNSDFELEPDWDDCSGISADRSYRCVSFCGSQ